MNWHDIEQDLKRRMQAQPRGYQTRLAERLGIKQPSVAAYISGSESIPLAHLDAILDTLGLKLAIVPNDQA